MNDASARELSADDLFGSSSVMAILRNFSTEVALELAHRAWDLGIELVEVPIQTPDAVPTLEAVTAAGRERGRIVGAGTVTTLEQLEQSVAAGVGFTVAPGLSREIVEASRQLGLVHLPGVATATEIQQAVALGCEWVKAFPAAELGPQWFTAMRGPFPNVRFVATGGMTAQNAKPFLAAGVSCVAVGSALSDPEQVDRLVELLDRRSPEGDGSTA